MKLTLPLLLLAPTLLFAQSAPPQGDPQQMFDQAKKTMLPMIQKSLPAMEKTQSCIQKSANTDDLNKCVGMMLEYQKQMAEMAGKSAPKMPTPESLNLQWSEELKGQIVADIGKSIERTGILKGCLESSFTNEEMGACIQKSMPKAR